MAITYGELKHNLIDLGFEVDSDVESEYPRVMLNAINRASQTLWDVVVLPYMSYFEDKYDLDEDEGFTKLTADSDDDDEMNIPDVLEPMEELLAAHWLWLDDDLTKATIYWNEFDDLKNQLIAVIRMPRKAKIVGGF